MTAGWELPRIFDYLDVANVQGYDFHGSGSDNSWEPNRTGHQGNLYEDADDPYPTKFSVATSCYTGSQWWTYDDPWSIARKTAWLRSRGLLGVMAWEMSGDTGALMNAVDAEWR